jgi:hypothetical protein
MPIDPKLLRTLYTLAPVASLLVISPRTAKLARLGRPILAAAAFRSCHPVEVIVGKGNISCLCAVEAAKEIDHATALLAPGNHGLRDVDYRLERNASDHPAAGTGALNSVHAQPPRQRWRHG